MLWAGCDPEVGRIWMSRQRRSAMNMPMLGVGRGRKQRRRRERCSLERGERSEDRDPG
jgi:hypothetical protein